jgi:predicted GNAT family acetyltransferase
MDMGWHFTDSVAEFAASAGAFIAADPERHTVGLTVMESVQAGVRWSDDDMHFGWWIPDGAVRAAVFLTPPYPLQLIGVPAEAVGDLVDALRDRGAPVAAVNGERRQAEDFALGWIAGTALVSTVAMEQRLYRLEELRAPDLPASGNGRLATSVDLDLVVGWFTDFHAEAAAEEVTAEHLRDNAHRRIEQGLVWLWEDAGESVAMAARNATAAGIARIGPVFTPIARRRKGYGTAVTAACTHDALAAGARGAVLFTDLSNPTSNAIYQTIGYRPLEDRTILRFADQQQGANAEVDDKGV